VKKKERFLPGVCCPELASGGFMEAWLLLLVVLLVIVRHLPGLGHYLCKGVAEFCQGLRWYRAELDDQAARWLIRGLAVALGMALLGMLAVGGAG
jgi:hypothetical protein